MNYLRAKDIYCDSCTEKKTTAKTFEKALVETTSRPIKLRKKEHRRCSDSKMKIRRNLFGPVDHENTENFLKRELDILSDLSNRKWNFDFTTEKPLDGRWIWESVGPKDPTVPSAYKGTTYTQDQILTRCEIERSGSEVPTNPVILGISTDRGNLNNVSRGSSSTRTVPSKKSGVVKRKDTALQPNIKGFLAVKKRKGNPDSPENIKCKGLKDNSSPTFLHIMKSNDYKTDRPTDVVGQMYQNICHMPKPNFLPRSLWTMFLHEQIRSVIWCRDEELKNV